MSRTLSPSTHQLYGLARVAAAWGLPRSTYYARRDRRNHPGEPRKRGPKTPFTDAELTGRIRQEIAASPFTGEGHRKFWGAAPGRRRPHLQGSGLAPDAGSSTSGAPTPGRTRCAQGAYRNHHHRSPEPDVGHRCHRHGDPRRWCGHCIRPPSITARPIVSAFTPPNGRRVLKPSIPSGKASKSTSPAFTPTRPPGFDSVMIMGPNS